MVRRTANVLEGPYQRYSPGQLQGEFGEQYSEDQGERFHQDILKFKERYQSGILQ